MNTWSLSLRMFLRDLRGGELRILLAALVIAVASVATVGFFTDRVRGALNQEATQLLGGDLAFAADHPVPGPIAVEATRLGLASARVTTFPSMVLAGDAATLSEIKAVSGGYPLRGVLRTAAGEGLADQATSGIPEPGTVWVGDRLLAKLGVSLGDAVEVGTRRLTIARLVTKEPDNAFDYFNVAPRVLLNEADLASTGLIQEGSRIRYRMLVAGEAAQVEAFRAFTRPRLARGERLESVRDARSEVRAALDRAERFLGLAAMLSVIIAAAGVALAARRFMRRELDACAIMRCLGATQPKLLRLYLVEFGLIGVAAALLGGVLGFAAQFALVELLRGLVATRLPLPGVMPAVAATMTGFVLLAGFAVPPLLRLKSVPTMRVLRREMEAGPVGIAAYAVGFAALAALLYWQAGDARVWQFTVGGLAGCVAFAAGAGWALISALARLRGAGGVAFRYGLASLRRRAGTSIAQMTALGLGIMALLLLTLVRGDLMSAWRNNLPADAANRFVINLQPEQVAAFRQFFASRKQPVPEVYPMIRGRLTAINGVPLDTRGLEEGRTRRLAEREFNLSYTRDLRPDNKVVAGRWDGAAKGELSVEDGIAKTLGIGLGDRLTYNVAGQKVEGKVTSLRKLDWESFKVNFFVTATPGLLDSMPTSYVTSFHLPRAQEALANELVRELPNLTLIDVGAILDQVRSIADQVARAVEFVFVFTLAAGLTVLYAAMVSSQDERIYEAAIMRTLGARRRQIRVAQLAEFLAIGLIAGVIAALAASLVSWGVSTRVLNLPWQLNLAVPAWGVLLGCAGIAFTGLAATRATLARPPLETIRGLT